VSAGAVVAALSLASGLAAQVPAPTLRLVAKRDTVLVYVTDTGLVRPGGFVVYRRPAAGAGGGWTKRSAAPVEPVRDPSAAAGRLVADLPMVMRAVRATDAPEMLRRLSTDRFAAGVLSLLSRNVAVVLGRLFADTAATVGAEYEYRVVFTDAAGGETGRALTGRARVTDVVPSAPSPPTARVADHEIDLTWHYPPFTGAPGDLVVGFHVYRSGADNHTRRLTATPVLRNDAPGAKLEFRDREPGNGVPYRYTLTALDIAGRESAPSPPMAARAQDVTPPGIPTELAVRNGNGVVTVTWRLSPEADVRGYHIERSTGLSGPFTRLDHAPIPVAQPLWTDSVPGGRQYFYRVVAVDSSGNVSRPSNAIAAFPVDRTPPLPPPSVTATPLGHRLVIHWTASPSRDVRGYYLYHGSSPDHLVRLVSQPLAALQFTDSGSGTGGLTPGASYIVRVSAVDSSFNESARVEARVRIADDRPPAPPSAFRVENVRGRYVELSWSASGALDVHRYVLTRTGGATARPVEHAFAGDVRSWRDTSVVHAATYRYRLTAVDSAGNSSPAVADSVLFRDFTPPPAPRAASARLVGKAVQVRWERVVTQELAGYHVYRATLPTGVFRRLTTTPIAVLTFTDTAGHASLFYRVRAVDRSGNESAPSPVAGVTP
jgi:fibronectin type 3 domain-containing protein